MLDIESIILIIWFFILKCILSLIKSRKNKIILCIIFSIIFIVTIYFYEISTTLKPGQASLKDTLDSLNHMP